MRGGARVRARACTADCRGMNVFPPAARPSSPPPPAPASYAGADLTALFDEAERASAHCRDKLLQAPGDARLPVATLRSLSQGGAEGGSSQRTGGAGMCVLEAEDKYFKYMQLVCG